MPGDAAFRVHTEPAVPGVIRVFTNASDDPLFEVVGSEAGFSVPAGTTWVRAELTGPDGAEVRRATCDPLVGDETSYCRDRVGLVALTSAVYVEN